MPSLLPTLYRELLRLGRQLDAAPLSKALLLAQPERIFDHASAELVALPQLTGTDGEWLARLHAFNRGEYYAPDTSAKQTVLDSRHCAPAPVDPVSLGLRAMRVMSVAVAAGTALAPPRKAPQSVPEPARVPVQLTTGEIGVGSLLLTHPVSCLHQRILHRSVILLTDVDDDGVAGVIINKPQGRSLGDSVGSAARAAIGDSLCTTPLHTGGDCQMNMLLLLHDFPVVGSTPVANGLFVTNDVAAVRTALDTASRQCSGAAHGSRIKALAGYAGWARHQLEAELQRNVWFHVEASDTDLVELALREEEEAPPPRDGEEADVAGTAVWSGAMRALGGEHTHFAEFPAKEDLVWGQLQDLWEQQRTELQRRIDMDSRPLDR
jgi:putative AlgH/UPF0301 family transcriptional regulator